MKHSFRLKSAAIACLALMLTACTPPVKHNTASGKPETTISKTTKAKAKDALSDMMVNLGYRPTRSDDSMIAFDRPVDNPMAAAFFGSRYDSTPNARVTYQLIQQDQNVRVIADCAIITNPGSAFEKRADANGNQDTIMVQGWMDYVRIKLETKK